MASTKIRVHFAVEGDEQAAKIAAVLEALGYEVVRDLDPDAGPSRLRWAVARLTQNARLTEREAHVLEMVLQGRSNPEIAKDLQIHRATLKWHMHNIFTKTGTVTREGLLREALQLGGVNERESIIQRLEHDQVGFLAEHILPAPPSAPVVDRIAPIEREPWVAESGTVAYEIDDAHPAEILDAMQEFIRGELSERDPFDAIVVRSESDDDRLRQFDEFIEGEAAANGSVAEEACEIEEISRG